MYLLAELTIHQDFTWSNSIIAASIQPSLTVYKSYSSLPPTHPNYKYVGATQSCMQALSFILVVPLQKIRRGDREVCEWWEAMVTQSAAWKTLHNSACKISANGKQRGQHSIQLPSFPSKTWTSYYCRTDTKIFSNRPARNPMLILTL